jgi:hypothetical protein
VDDIKKITIHFQTTYKDENKLISSNNSTADIAKYQNSYCYVDLDQKLIDYLRYLSIDK